MTGILTNAQFRGAPEHAIGSSRLRGASWSAALPDRIKMWQPGERYSALILQKADYQPVEPVPLAYDLCDLDVRPATLDLLRRCRAVSVCTGALRSFYQPLLGEVPVLLIDDVVPDGLARPVAPAAPASEVRKLIWFGYRHNAAILEPWTPLLKRAGVTLTCVSNLPIEWADETIPFESLEQVVELFQSFDAALLPDYHDPLTRALSDGWKYQYKSLNKTYLALQCGLPVISLPDRLGLSVGELQQVDQPGQRRARRRNFDYLRTKVGKLLELLT